MISIHDKINSVKTQDGCFEYLFKRNFPFPIDIPSSSWINLDKEGSIVKRRNDYANRGEAGEQRQVVYELIQINSANLAVDLPVDVWRISCRDRDC